MIPWLIVVARFILELSVKSPFSDFCVFSFVKPFCAALSDSASGSSSLRVRSSTGRYMLPAWHQPLYNPTIYKRDYMVHLDTTRISMLVSTAAVLVVSVELGVWHTTGCAWSVQWRYRGGRGLPICLELSWNCVCYPSDAEKKKNISKYWRLCCRKSKIDLRCQLW